MKNASSQLRPKPFNQDLNLDLNARKKTQVDLTKTKKLAPLFSGFSGYLGQKTEKPLLVSFLF